MSAPIKMMITANNMTDLKHLFLQYASMIKDGGSEVKTRPVTPSPDESDDADDGVEESYEQMTFQQPAFSPTQTTVVPVHPPVQDASGELTTTQLDSEGLPWDKRIHSSSKALNKDGTWRLRKNIKQELVEQVVAELRAKTPSVATASSPGTVPSSTVPQATQPAPQVAAPTIPSQTSFPGAAQGPQGGQAVQTPVGFQSQPAVAPTNVVPMIPQPQAAKPAHNFQTFSANFIPTIAELIKRGDIDQTYVDQLCTYFGVKQIWELTAYPDKLGELFNTWAQTGIITAVQ